MEAQQAHLMAWGEPTPIPVAAGMRRDKERAEKENVELREHLNWALDYVEFLPTDGEQARFKRAKKLARG